MDKHWYLPLIICLIAGLQFVVSNEALKGYLRSEENLAKEVKTPIDSIEDYRISQEAPFKFRLLFPVIIKGTYELVYEDDDAKGFFNTYRFWSLIFYITSALSMWLLLFNVGFNEKQSFVGALIFLLLPPMLMAFTLPVHTREDTLAYTLFFTGLVLFIKDKKWPFLIVCLAGAITRETLLLMPLLYLFYAKDQNFARRFLISGLPVLLWMIIRFAGGFEDYDVWEGFRWNITNPEQVIGFAFITFNVLWLPFLIHVFFFKKHVHYTPQDLRFFYKSSIFAIVVILITTFFGGIFNEIRLLNLFSPWMIIIFLDTFRNYREIFKDTFGRKGYWVFVAAAAILCVAILFITLKHREDLIVPGKYAVPYDQWIIASVCYIFILLIFIPHAFKIFSLKNSAK